MRQGGAYPDGRLPQPSGFSRSSVGPQSSENANRAKPVRPVGEIADTLGLEQPSVSKHLRVLLEVGLVHVRRDGRRMMYRTNIEAIRPLHEWASTFEPYWRHQLSRAKECAERKCILRSDAGSNFGPRREHHLDDNKN